MKIKLIKSRNLVRNRLPIIIMRTFIFLLCTTVFSFNTEISFSQEQVNIEVNKKVTVDEVFNIIQDQTKYRFMYPQDLFVDAPKVRLRGSWAPRECKIASKMGQVGLNHTRAVRKFEEVDARAT